MRTRWLKALVPAVLLLSGPSPTAAERKPTVPALKSVKSIRIVARASGDAKTKCEFTAGKRFVSNTIAWLMKVDWSQKGVGLESIQLIRPDVELTVIEKSGKTHRYEFYWRGNSFIDHDSNRMLQIDLEFFRISVIGEIIRHCAAREKKPNQ